MFGIHAPRRRFARRPRKAVAHAALTVLLVASAVVAAPEIARADNPGIITHASDQTGCPSSGESVSKLNPTENRIETFYNVSLESATATAVSWARSNAINPTDVDTSTASSLSSADVAVFDQLTNTCGMVMYGNGGTLLGVAICTTLYQPSGGNDLCDKHQVIFSPTAITAWGTNGGRALACHEIGHTLGLLHTSQSASSCMRGAPASGTPYTTLGSSQTTAVNSHY